MHEMCGIWRVMALIYIGLWRAGENRKLFRDRKLREAVRSHRIEEH